MASVGNNHSILTLLDRLGEKLLFFLDLFFPGDIDNSDGLVKTSTAISA